MGRKGSELSSDLKSVAVSLYKDGFKIKEIAEKLGRPHSTIS